MTSMPASRKARAMTLAPRSCPSSPGLATSTRILMSAIDHYLNTEGTQEHRGCASSQDFPCDPLRPLWLQGLDVEAPPHVPAGDAAIGRPGAGDLFHVFGLRQLSFLVVL